MTSQNKSEPSPESETRHSLHSSVTRSPTSIVRSTISSHRRTVAMRRNKKDQCHDHHSLNDQQKYAKRKTKDASLSPSIPESVFQKTAEEILLAQRERKRFESRPCCTCCDFFVFQNWFPEFP